MIDCMTCGCNVCLCEGKHRNHWLYNEARKLTEDVRDEQIRKGSEKYETPLGDAGWTPEQLVHHAMMENVDQAHYLTALLFEIKKMKQQNNQLIKALKYYESPGEQYCGRCDGMTWVDEGEVARDALQQIQGK